MIGVTGTVCVVNTRVKHAKPKEAQGGKRGLDGLPWNQSTVRGVSIMRIDGQLFSHGDKWLMPRASTTT